jgi:beta-glucuronidase
MTAGEAKGDLGVCLLRPGQPETLTGELAVPQAQPWSPEQPRLYDFTVKLWEGEEETDCLTRRIGFRRIEARGARIELNGAPLFLKGFNYHEDSPRTGMAPDPEGGRRDLEGMKAAGANFVRLAHYPHHPATLDLCDQLGLLTLAEIPLWQWRIAKPDPEATALTAAAAERQLRAMIARDGHHPSVIFWSVSNECAEDQEGVVAAIHNLLRLARQEDPGRLAVHVSNYWLKHPHFEEDDVICVNHYPSWGKRLGPDGHGYDLAKSADDWRSALEALHRRYPGKPVLVTEFGYPALAGIPGGGAGEVTQAKVIEGEMGGIRHPAVCGMALWCWADHEWTFHDLPALGPITISPFGVVTRNRQPKAALKVLSRLFRELRGGGPESP